MANEKTVAFADTSLDEPIIHTIDLADLRDALSKGLDDFWANPTHLVLLAMIYPIVGLLMARMMFHYDVLPLLFPIISGFALIGPLAAVGLYEMSRRRERGLEVSWTNALDALKSPSIGSIFALGCLQLVIYLAWVGAALTIYRMTFGSDIPESIPNFAHDVLTTGAGWALIIIGCGVGILFAVAVLIVSVVSFPMLLDRDIGAVKAVQTSIRAVSANPVTMAMWGIIVAVLLAIGIVPLFVGLAFVMPVLGHATWHLYRKVVEI